MKEEIFRRLERLEYRVSDLEEFRDEVCGECDCEECSGDCSEECSEECPTEVSERLDLISVVKKLASEAKGNGSVELIISSGFDKVAPVRLFLSISSTENLDIKGNSIEEVLGKAYSSLEKEKVNKG